MSTPGTTPTNTPQNTADNTTDKLQQLTELLEAALNEGTPGEVELLQVTPAGRKPIARYPLDQFDAFSVGITHGGGKYMARLKLQGRYVCSATFDAGGPAIAKPVTFPAPMPQFAPQPQYAPQPQPATTDIGAKDLLAIMLQQQQTSNQMMMQQQQQQMQMFTTLLQTSLAKSNATPATDALTMLKEVRQLAREERGDVGGGDDEGFATVTKQLLPYLAPLLAGGAQPQRVQNVARRQLTAATVRPQVATIANPTITTTVTQPATTPQMTPATQPADVAAVSAPAPLRSDLASQIEVVKRCAAIGMPARATAHMLYGIIDDNPDQDEADEQLNTIATTEPDSIVNQLATVEPAFANPHVAQWAAQVWAELRDIVQAAQVDDPDADLGEDPDPAQNAAEKPDAGGALEKPAAPKPDVP